MLVAPVSDGRPDCAQRQQQFAVGRELANGVVEIVGAVDDIVRALAIRPDRDAVRPHEQTLAPRTQEGAVRSEDADRMLAAVKDVNAVVRGRRRRAATSFHFKCGGNFAQRSSAT